MRDQEHPFAGTFGGEVVQHTPDPQGHIREGLATWRAVVQFADAAAPFEFGRVAGAHRGRGQQFQHTRFPVAQPFVEAVRGGGVERGERDLHGLHGPAVRRAQHGVGDPTGEPHPDRRRLLLPAGRQRHVRVAPGDVGFEQARRVGGGERRVGGALAVADGDQFGRTGQRAQWPRPVTYAR